jgi:hypothetical protein
VFFLPQISLGEDAGKRGLFIILLIYSSRLSRKTSVFIFMAPILQQWFSSMDNVIIVEKKYH